LIGADLDCHFSGKLGSYKVWLWTIRAASRQHRCVNSKENESLLPEGVWIPIPKAFCTKAELVRRDRPPMLIVVSCCDVNKVNLSIAQYETTMLNLEEYRLYGRQMILSGFGLPGQFITL
jgi:hypothetical protein